MMHWLFLLPAFATPPTAETFDLSRLDDPRPWQEQAQVLLDGPERCIEVQGTIRVQVSIYIPGGIWSAGGQRNVVAEGTFEGRLDHGVWTRIDATWTDAPNDALAYMELDRFRPIVGRIPKRKDPEAAAKEFEADIKSRYTADEIVGMGGPTDDSPGSMAITKKGDRIGIHIDGGGDEALGLLYDVLEEFDPDGTALYVTWQEDKQRVLLTESIPLSKKDTFTVQVMFPNGDSPTQLDVVFPKRFKMENEEDAEMSVRDAQLHLRSQSTDLGVVPGVEGASAVVRMYGFTIGFDQRVAYRRVRACSNESP
ncbi:MAG: hypothetical protein CL927_11865 [Deltaproteobacteria bacterium]|nr:hypothetical protein [Deltaproteobacteria bacterium]HCH62590.1 hypothetical protein [Deltaproteobacteria bacterium]